jgi:hypothetical protein
MEEPDTGLFEYSAILKAVYRISSRIQDIQPDIR